MTRRFRASIVVASAPLFLFGCTAILGNFDVADVPTNTSPESGATDAPTTGEGGGGPDAGPDADAGPAHLDSVKMVAAGAQHTCALTKSNDVYCWGHNGNGQLGQTTGVASSALPLKVSFPVGVLNITSIVAGAFHTCVTLGAGDMYCWGLNDCGQTGAGDLQNPGPPRKVIDPVAAAPRWVSVGPGDHHTCGVDSSGTTYCWGCNGGFVLGAAAGGSTSPIRQPTTAGAEKAPARFVSASPLFNCIVNTTSQVGCWGSESAGELGNGDPPDTQTSDGVAVFPIIGTTTSANAIATGGSHTCIVDQDKGITCWGDDSAGQLGFSLTPTQIDQSAPGPKVANGQAKANLITAGAKFTCYTNATDTVICMGSNVHGELGRGGAPDTSIHAVPDNVLRPDSLTGGFRSISIAAGRQHACAVAFESPNEVLCWGDDTDGQLGDGTLNAGSKTTPVSVLAPK